MNTPIRRLSVFSLLLLLVLMLNVTWLQGFQAETIREDPLKRRAERSRWKAAYKSLRHAKRS